MEAIVIGLLPIVGWGAYAYLPSSYVCGPCWIHSISFSLFVFISCFVATILIMFYCYIKIWQTATKHAQSISNEVNYPRNENYFDHAQTKATEHFAISDEVARCTPPNEILEKNSCEFPDAEDRFEQTTADFSTTDDLSATSLTLTPVPKVMSEQPAEASPQCRGSSVAYKTNRFQETNEHNSDVDNITVRRASLSMCRSAVSRTRRFSLENRCGSRDLLNIENGGSPNENVNNGRMRQARITVRIFLLILVFLCCWIPYGIVHFYETYKMFDIQNVECFFFQQYVYTLTSWLALLSCAVNPFIYSVKSKRFRKSAKRLATNARIWFRNRGAVYPITSLEDQFRPVKHIPLVSLQHAPQKHATSKDTAGFSMMDSPHHSAITSKTLHATPFVEIPSGTTTEESYSKTMQNSQCLQTQRCTAEVADDREAGDNFQSDVSAASASLETHSGGSAIFCTLSSGKFVGSHTYIGVGCTDSLDHDNSPETNL